MSKNYKDTEDVVRNIEAAKAKVHPIPAIKYKIASHSMKQRNETHKNKIEFFTDHSKLIAEYKASEQFWQNSQETIKQSFSEEIRDNDGISEEYQQLINSFKDDLDEQLSNEEEEENENKEKQQKKNEEYKPELPSYFSALLPSEEDEKLLSKKRRQENQHQTAEEFRSLWESIAQNERELQNDLADERRSLRRIKEDVRGCGPETFEGRILEIKENINTFKKKLNQQKTELNKEENEAQADLDSSVIVNPRTVADMNLLFAEKFSYFNDYTPISSINALNSQVFIGTQHSQILHSGSALSTQIQQQSQLLKEKSISSIMNKQSINSANKSSHLPVLIKHSSQPQLNTKLNSNQQQTTNQSQNRGNSPLRQQNLNQQKIQSTIKQQQQIEKQLKSSESSLKSKQRPISNERNKPQIIEAKKDMKRGNSSSPINTNRANSSNSKQQPKIQNQQQSQLQIKQSSPKQPPQTISRQRSSPQISQQPSKSETKFNTTKVSGSTVASSSSTVQQMFVDDLDNISEQISQLNEKLKNLLTYKPQLEHCSDSIDFKYNTSQQQQQSSNFSTINSKVETRTPFITEQQQEEQKDKELYQQSSSQQQQQQIQQQQSSSYPQTSKSQTYSSSHYSQFRINLTQQQLQQRIIQTLRSGSMKSKKRMDVAEKLAWELQKEEEIRSNLYENGEIIDDNQGGNELMDENEIQQGNEQENDNKLRKQQIQPVFWTNALIEVVKKRKQIVIQEILKYLDWHEAVASLHKLIETTQQIYVTQKLKAIEYDKMATKSQLEYLALLNQRFAEQAELQKQRDEIDRRLEQQRILFQAKQEEMNKRIQYEEEIRRKEEEREKEKEEKEREKNKVELEEYHRALREMQWREALELAELEEQAKIEREKQGIINKERVEYRQKEYEQQKAQQQEKEVARIEAEAEKERMLERIREQVRIYAKNDPERLLQPTESSKAAMEAEEWRRADLFAINGYTDDQMFADPRFHFQFLLNERGVGQTDYAKEIMAKIPPQRPPRIDALTSDQKAVEIKSRKDNIFLPIFGKKSE